VDNKQVAALVAVLHYLQEETSRRQALEVTHLKPYSINHWSLYGRKTIMQLRSWVQGRREVCHAPLSFEENIALSRVQGPLRIRKLMLSRNRPRSPERIHGAS
jgi:hypothetical protein